MNNAKLDVSRFLNTRYWYQMMGGNVHVYDFVQIKAPNFKDNIFIGFSNGFSGHNDDKWEIVLGGWGGKKHVIRYGNRKSILAQKSDSNRSYFSSQSFFQVIFRHEFDQWKQDFIVQVTDGNIGVYVAVQDAKGDLILELNDERIKKSELDTIVASGGWGGSGNIQIRGVGGDYANLQKTFCIEVESSNENCNSGTHTGSSIAIFHNNIEKATIPPKFEQFSFCLPINYVNIENDKFKLHMKNSDGVSYHFAPSFQHLFFFISNF